MPPDKCLSDELLVLREEYDWLRSNLDASSGFGDPETREVARTIAETLAQVRARIDEIEAGP